MKSILVLGTLDTKEDLILYVKKEIELLGHKTIVMDTSTRGNKSPADIRCEDVARAGGATFEEILRMEDRDKITALMIQGAIAEAKALLSENRLDGIIALGGAGAATVGTAVMRALPFGIPKLMVSTAAGMQAYAGKWFGTGDIMMMNTIVDLAGLNRLVQNILSRAVGAICGMVQQTPSSLSELLERGERPLIAMTEDGSSEWCASYVRRALEERGYEVVIFHAQGIGDRAMEDIIHQGFFDAVVDICVVGVSDELFDGNRPGGPHRLERAGERGIPQVMTPCGLNMTGCGPTRKNREKYASRPRVYKLDDLRMGTRLNEEELILTARVVAEKLNKARGPVKYFIPLDGWSGFDLPGGVLHSPGEDKVFIDELKRLVDNPLIEIIEVEGNLETPSFAQAVVDGFIQLMENNERGCDKENHCKVKRRSSAWDVVVVGAGPGGSAAAKKCAELGMKTLILERKKLPRDKVCSGMVAGPLARETVQQEFGDIPKEVLVSPFHLSGQMFHVPQVDPKVLEWDTLVAWRKDLDHWMNEKAQDKGVEIWDGVKFAALSHRGNGCRVFFEKNGERQELEASFVIGADGAGSAVRKALFPELKVKYSAPVREFYEGRLDLDKHYLHWFFPRSRPRPRFNVNHKGDYFLIEGSGIKELREEIAPILIRYGFNPKRQPVSKDACKIPLLHSALISGAFSPARGNVLLIGDAACLLLPITFEGIGTALKSGLFAAAAISEAAGRGLQAARAYLQNVRPIIETIRTLYALNMNLEKAADKGPKELSEALKTAYQETLTVV